MISIKNNSLKSLSAGITTRAGGGKVGQYPARKAGQPTSGTKVKPAAPTLKAVETAKPPKAPTRPKPFVVSKALAASKVLNVSPAPGTLKPVAACKPLNIVKRSSAPKASGLLKTRAASKVLDIAGAADTPKLPPGLKLPDLRRPAPRLSPPASRSTSLFETRSASKVVDTDPKVPAGIKAPDASKTPSPRISAVEAVRRQIHEQKQKAAAVTARKAKGKSEPLPSAKLKAVTTATPPSPPAMRPKVEVIKAEVIKAEVITSTANAAENAPPLRSPARRPLPAIRKGGVRKPLAVVSRPSSTSSPPSSPAHTGGGCSRHQRNSLSAAERLSDHTLTRRNAIRMQDPMNLRSSMHAAAVTRSSSAPLLGWAKAAAAMTRSKSGPVFLSKVVKPAGPQPADADAEVELKVLQAMSPDAPSGEEGAVDASSITTVSDVDTSTISTLVGSDEDASVGAAVKANDADTSTSTLIGSDEGTSVHEPFAALPRFQIEIQDFDV
ncbi:hypothetical protein EWM64_g5103 [Hericium alpestre]|uniref:Uncharacterized protein n=1 Tax=Hericium alpestre TaxID=135208 RepID=A0A4Y9ZXI7_9AGAM|nr:hypothetical protein EWM64_g5103 [Hericium alpestre]